MSSSRLSKFLGMGAVFLAAAVLLAACATNTGSADSSTSSQPDPVTAVVATTTTQPGPVTTLAATTTTTQPGPTTTIDDGTEVTVVEGEPYRQPNSEPTATYTGGACDYDGPSEFDVDSTVAFTVTNESDGTQVGFAIWKFPSGVTSEEIFSEGIFQATGSGDRFTAINFPPNAIGDSQALTVFFDTPGQWGINCFDIPEGDLPGSDYVTMFTVNG